MSKDEPHTRTRARQGLPVAERLLRRFTDAAQEAQVGRIQGLLEAQAHANPDLKKLSLHAGEDAGSKRNIDAPQRHRWLATALVDIEPRLRKVMGDRHTFQSSVRRCSGN